MPAHAVSEVGGIFALLALLHFLVDWGWQSHDEATKKATCSKCRAVHCLKYSAAMSAPLLLLVPGRVALTSMVILWVSHFIIDTYIPVFLWAHFFRRPPQLKVDDYLTFDYWGAFKEFSSDPLGRILCLVIDQVLHLVYLIPVAILVVYPHQLSLVIQATLCNFIILGLVVFLIWAPVRKAQR